MRKETGMQTDPRKREEKFTAGPVTHTLPLTPINQLTEGDRTEKAQSLCFHPFPVVPSLSMAPLFLGNTDTSSTSAKSQRFSGKPALLEQEYQSSKVTGQRVDFSEQHILQKPDLWWETGHRTQEIRTTQAPSHPLTSPQLMKEV